MSSLLRRADPFTLLVLLLAAVWVTLGWSPSSYGLALERIGVEETGLVLGQPRAIRSDEWGIQTPLVQAAVHNDLQRFNHSSLYEDDLRSFIPLPLWDWALLLRPWFWLYPLGHPALAFSFSWAFLGAAFLIGYRRLLHAFGFDAFWAATGSLLLFFCGVVQTRWTTDAPALACFPWVLMAWMGPGPAWRRAPLLALALAVWVLGLPYPPLLIPLAWVGLLLVLALQPAALRPRALPFVLAAGLAAAGLVAHYFWRILPILAQTTYPGQRISTGGDVAPLLWADQWLPGLATAGFHNLVGENICEASSAGSWLPLLVVLFVDYRALCRRWRTGQAPWRPVLLLLLGWLAISTWMLLPIPGNWLMFLGLHRAPPVRFLFPAGLCLLVLTLFVLQQAPLVWRGWRLGLAGGVALVVWLVSRHLANQQGVSQGWSNWALVGLLLVAWRLRRRWPGLRPAQVLAGTAVATAVISWGGFNPIQSARPIFQAPDTPLSRALDGLQAEDPRGWLVVAGFNGALLNGWGYRALTHTLLEPHIAFFAPFFPELGPVELDGLFNRTGSVGLVAGHVPRLYGQHVMDLPMERFLPAGQGATLAQVPRLPRILPQEGWIERVSLQDQVLTVEGWGRFDARHGDGLQVVSALPINEMFLLPLLRSDVAAALTDPGAIHAGFRLELRLGPEAPADPLSWPLCLAVTDGAGRTTVLRGGPSYPWQCR